MGYREEVLADNPVGYWRLGESSGTVANDETANNLDGTYVNTPTLGVAGAVSGNPAVTLSGVDEYISVPNATALNVGDVFSVECFIKRSRTGVFSGEAICDKGPGAFFVTLDADNKVLLRKNGGGSVVTSTVGITDTTAWHHVVVTKNGATTKVYIDGVDRTGSVSNLTMGNTTNQLRWGAESSNFLYLGASLDEVAIYPTALSATRVQAHYNAASAPPTPPPTADFVVTGSGFSRTFADASTPQSGTTITSRSWNFGDGGTSTATNPSHTYAAPGTYVVTLTVTASDGQTDTESKSVTVVANQPPGAAYSYTVTTLTVAFTDLSADPDGSITSRHWDFGDGSTSTATNPSRTYTVGGTYTVTLTVTDNGGLTDTETKQVTVGTPPPPPPEPSDDHGDIAKETAPSHAGGLYTENVMPTWPTNGHLTLHDLCRPSALGGEWFARLVASRNSEQTEIRLLNEPVAPGNVAISLNGVVQQVPIGSVPEVAKLTLTGAPTAPGTVAVRLDAGAGLVTYPIVAGGAKESFTLNITGQASTNGYVTLTIDGADRITYVYARDTAETAATRIARAGYPGWNVAQNGTLITFTAVLPGPRANATFSAGTTRLPFTLTPGTDGTAETAAQLAARIREGAYAGWTASQGATPEEVVFTAVSGGFRTNAEFYAGSTGATGTMTTTTQGTIDTAEQVAARIRATAFSGWTVTGSGLSAIFTATTAGLRQNASYDDQGTGATAYVDNLRQGSDGDVILEIRHADAFEERRKLFDGLEGTDNFKVDYAVNGAGTDRAVISAWGSLNSGPWQHLARFSDVDLTGFPLAIKKIGVTDESSTGLTWEHRTLHAKVSDRGLSWFRDHNVLGEWLGQVRGEYDPTQPVRNDLLLQGARVAVVPGRQYVLSAFARANNDAPVPARLLVATAYSALGNPHELGDVSNTTGVTGEAGWTEYNRTITIPPNCYELHLGSKDIGAGGYVVQEVALSPVGRPKRTYAYATSGTYRSTFDLRTARGNPSFSPNWRRERFVWRAPVRVPEGVPGASAAVLYRVAPPDPTNELQPGTWTDFASDPDLLPQYPFLQTDIALTGDGTQEGTPAISREGPFVEYAVYSPEGWPLSMLLTEDRDEIPGGAVFNSLEEWSRDKNGARLQLASGDLYDEPQLFAAIGILPPSSVYVFSAEGRRYVEENWRRPFCVEAFGEEVLTVKLSARPVFERVGGSQLRDVSLFGRQALYEGQLEWCQVLAVAPMASAKSPPGLVGGPL